MAEDAAAEEPAQTELELFLDPEDHQLLDDTQQKMAIARDYSETVRLSLRFAGWVLSLRAQGYQLGMVKGNHVEPLEWFN
jgi:hypothetical protein